jgi:hypothetical protein
MLREMTMGRFALSLLGFFFASVSVGQQQQSGPKEKLFQFGASADDTYKIFGTPQKWWNFRTGRYIDAADEYAAALKTFGSGMVEDVYLRETTGNLYEIRLSWLPDTSVSRLRPTPRLHQLDVRLDKAASVRSVLLDFPEAFEICKLGCDLYGVPDITGYYILAFPLAPKGDQYGDQWVKNFYRSVEAPAEYSIGVELKVPQDYSVRPTIPNLDTSKVIDLRLEATALRYVLDKSDLGNRTRKLGTWKP